MGQTEIIADAEFMEGILPVIDIMPGPLRKFVEKRVDLMHKSPEACRSEFRHVIQNADIVYEDYEAGEKNTASGKEKKGVHTIYFYERHLRCYIIVNRDDKRKKWVVANVIAKDTGNTKLKKLVNDFKPH